MKQRSVQQHAQMSDSTAVSAPKMSKPKAVGFLALLGLASPFLELSDPLHGIIGLIILFVGIRIAWKMTADRSVKISGPMQEPVAAPLG
jgi:hypothetical protein